MEKRSFGENEGSMVINIKPENSGIDSSYDFT